PLRHKCVGAVRASPRTCARAPPSPAAHRAGAQALSARGLSSSSTAAAAAAAAAAAGGDAVGVNVRGAAARSAAAASARDPPNALEERTRRPSAPGFDGYDDDEYNDAGDDDD